MLKCARDGQVNKLERLRKLGCPYLLHLEESFTIFGNRLCLVMPIAPLTLEKRM